MAQGDWRLWDWHCVALLLDSILTSAPVLTEVLAKTQFMQRLGEAFWHFSEAGAQPEMGPAGAAVATLPSATAGPGGGERVGGVGGLVGVALVAAPWTPPVLRLLACARQWLLLLTHHAAGRELLLARGGGSRAAVGGHSAPQSMNVPLDAALGLWAQLSRTLRGLLNENATSSRVVPASGLAASVAGRLLVSAASRALAAFGSGSGGGEKLFESPEAAAAAAIKDVVGAGVSGRQHSALFNRAEFTTTAARELLSVFGALASTDRGREVLQVGPTTELNCGSFQGSIARSLPPLPASRLPRLGCAAYEGSR